MIMNKNINQMKEFNLDKNEISKKIIKIMNKTPIKKIIIKIDSNIVKNQHNFKEKGKNFRNQIMSLV